MLGFVFDLIFPKKCVGCRKSGTYMCSNCLSRIEFFQHYRCSMCFRSSISGETHPSCITTESLDGISSGVVYKGVVKQLLLRVKHAPYVSDLGAVMGKLTIEALSQNELFMRVLSSHPIVAEVPLSPQILKTRGYNQAGILAKAVASEFNMKFNSNIIKRTKSINGYFKLHKKERYKFLQGVFVINPKNKKLINNKTVILVDDFTSSYATLRECARVLKQNGAKKVYGVTFASEL